ncbi:hypothetical protein NHH88_05990 [Oxalobacteraceae bacterium OTU3CAMAD1]|nr:hypothetical protein NHH88_05990 [Oxalobacteraceae bacterium OTU3CAMAD1]
MNIAPRARCYRLHEIAIPEAVIQQVGRRSVVTSSVPYGAFVYWPNGKPCIAVNQYLLENTLQWTGATPQTFAFSLCHLVTYCGNNNKGFGELSDGDIKTLIKELRTEPAEVFPGRARNHNTVRNIVHQCLCFLRWFQDTLYRGAAPLIGKSGTGASIVVTEHWNPHKQRTTWGHRFSPEPVSTERKQPISRKAIDALEDAIESKAVYEKMHDRIRRTHGLDDEFSKQCVDYLWRRRRFVLWLLQITGLRPGEMILLKAQDLGAAICSEKKSVGILSLPTLKRRRIDPPRRPFVLFAPQIEQLRRYLAGRRDWMEACAQHSGRPCITDALFLGTKPGGYGAGISLSALEKDFAELCVDAGLSEQQTCFSMFRHRFITQEVRLLLKEFKLKNTKVIADSDYRAILERVRAKTGHADVRSLWHYIELAEKEDGLFTDIVCIEESRANTHLVKVSLEELRRDFALGRLDQDRLLVRLAEISVALG